MTTAEVITALFDHADEQLELWQRFASKWATVPWHPSSFNDVRLVIAERCPQQVR